MNKPIARTPCHLLGALLAAMIIISACSNDEGSTAETTIESTDTTTSADDETTTTTATTETSDDPDDSTSTTDDGALPGEAWDGFASAGDELAVMGVNHDDELNVRSLPDPSSDIVASVGPTETDLIATGRARLLPESIWYEVDVDGAVGWVNASFVGFLGGTDDATSEYLADGSQGVAETMVDLGRAVSAAFASEEPESRIVQSVAPTVVDLGEITYDVIGLGDDAVAGYRLHIFATPDENRETFTLRTIERTVFCSRGTDGELCA